MNISTRNYDSLLPFLVVEAISAHATFNSMSVRIMDKGWAWLVSCRKLLVWKFKESKSATMAKSRRILSPCFELQLPQTDLIHKADLISVFFMPQNPNVSSRAITVPAALVISPEGTIRFWSNIANERFTESPVIDLSGQEFCTLVNLSPLEYLLGTTTGSVFLLTIDVTAHDSKNIILCSSLGAPSGLLSGIGRRVTNLFFGPMSESGSDMRRPLIAVPKYSQSTIDKTGSTDRPFFVMSSNFMLRQWSRTNESIYSTQQLVREWDLRRNIYAKLAAALGVAESDKFNFWPIDMITTKSKELLLLIVTLDTARDNAINYATCIFNPFQAADSLSNLTVLRSHSWNYSDESDDQLISLRFLERVAATSTLFMYDRKFLFLVDVNVDIHDAIDYGNQDDGILGAGLIDSHPILFTKRDGLIYVEPVSSNKSRLNETSIQIEPVPMTNSTLKQKRLEAQQASTSRVDPMIIEIDDEEINDVENQREGDLSQSRVHGDKSLDKSGVNQSGLNISLEQSTINKSMDTSTRRKANDISDILRENKEFEWIHQIDTRQYGAASETLVRLAQESEILKDRSETLLALSKLAKLAE